jgi:adenylate cyclase
MPDELHQRVGTGSAQRKLTAILSADVKGYSRLMGADEVGTHTTLKAYRKIMDGLIVRHGGRVVGTAGDGVLADFPSVVGALECAVDVQRALRNRNAGLPLDRRLEFRIGINLGDVIVDDDDIFGDGVNVAARLQAIGEPGGITVSGGVYDQVKNKFDLDFRDRGTQHVKNIADAVRVYSVEGSDIEGPARRSGRNWLWIAAAASALLVVGGGLTWLAPQLPAPPWRADDTAVSGGEAAEQPPDREASDPALPSGPSIAVLPFANRSGDPDQVYFSDGVTENIITALGRFPSLLVLSWHAVEPYRGETISRAQLRQELNMRYIVDGSVRRAGDRVRVTAELTDAEQGVLLWSDRHDERLDDLFEVQDRIAQKIVGTLVERVTQVERERALTKPTDNLDAYDYVLRGRHLLRELTRPANHRARTMFERAIELDPRYAEAYVGLGWTHVHDPSYGWAEKPWQSLERARENAEQARALDPALAPAHALLAQIDLWQRHYDTAAVEIGRAIDLNPNDAASWATRGEILLFSGQASDAIEALNVALRFDPNPVAWWLADLGLAQYLEGRYDDAVRTARRIGQQYDQHVPGHIVLAASHAQLDNLDQARRAAEDIRRLSPFFSAAAFVSGFVDPDDREHLIEGLEKAGLGSSS